MTGGPNLTFLWTQLGYQGPSLLVYMIAGLVAIMYIGRAPLPSVLTLIGVGIMFFTTLIVLALQTWIVNNRTPQLSSMMTAIGIVSSCIRAVGLGFLIAAIFVGRNEAPKDRYLHEENDE